MNKRNYFAEKQEMIKRAKSHERNMRLRYPIEIQNSIEKSCIYDNGVFLIDKPSINLVTEIEIMADNTIDAFFKTEMKEYITILNFASYKEPGGKFLQGSTAQEESLCHYSTLFNILSTFSKYYEWNNKNKNNAMYLNRAIYSKDILFINNPFCSDRYAIHRYANVITCAAPNWSTASKYNLVDKSTNSETLDSRIKFILKIASINNAGGTLILGAFGCGVFGQDPIEVASIFKYYLNGEFKNVFKRVIFAIPNNFHTENYNAFKQVFSL